MGPDDGLVRGLGHGPGQREVQLAVVGKGGRGHVQGDARKVDVEKGALRLCLLQLLLELEL
eukprot:3480072-Alexandrium_andersonii.AAC.1